MAKIPGISDAEWQVMNIVWNQGVPVTAAQVVEQLAAANNWSPRTVKTMLNRLVKKNALAFETRGKSYLYRAAVNRQQCIRGESKSFVNRVFGGAVGPMLVQFISQADLTDQEIEQLKQVLARKRH